MITATDTIVLLCHRAPLHALRAAAGGRMGKCYKCTSAQASYYDPDNGPGRYCKQCARAVPGAVSRLLVSDTSQVMKYGPAEQPRRSFETAISFEWGICEVKAFNSTISFDH